MRIKIAIAPTSVPKGISNSAAAALIAALMLAGAGNALANHTVLVEGQKDFDGDNLTGVAEDNDGDQVFGTLQAAIAGVSDNGRVVVVTSGRFFEQVNLQGNGVSVLEAAPGVTAVVEAFNAGGNMEANNARQQQPGIIVNSNGSFPIEIRNIVSRNWTDGIQINGAANVTLDSVRVDSNVNYGIHVLGSAKVAIVNSQVNSSGFRRSGTLGATPGGNVAPNPGIGIAFEGSSTGEISLTTVAHSFSDGISGLKAEPALNNPLFNNTIFNNNLGTGGRRNNGR